MKIKMFEFDVTLKRDGKEVKLVIDETSKKEVIGFEEEANHGTQDILTLSNDIGRFNDNQKTKIKGTLLPSEEESVGKLRQKMLVD